MNIKPIGDRIVLKALEKDNITASGIILPDSATKEKPYMYEVVAVGPGTKEAKMEVKVGDKILCGQYSGDEIKVDDTEYKILAMQYVLAIID